MKHVCEITANRKMADNDGTIIVTLRLKIGVLSFAFHLQPWQVLRLISLLTGAEREAALQIEDFSAQRLPVDRREKYFEITPEKLNARRVDDSAG